MRKFFTLIILLGMATFAMAQTVSESVAREKALQFFRGNASFAKGAQVQSPKLAYTAKSGDRPCFYVYNNGTSGFVIIGGDEAAREILGYSDCGAFDYDKAPENMKWWLSQYTSEIGAAISNTAVNPETARILKTAGTNKTDVSPMVQAKWNQGSPYYNAINTAFHEQQSSLASYNLLTGCVATAMAQVMAYHKWPTKGLGSHTSTTAKCTVNKKEYDFTASADFGSTTYDWDNMTNTYSSSSTAAQNSAVATLMYHCGVAVDMQYGDDGSGAYVDDVSTALKTYFRYSSTVNYQQRSSYTGNWEDLIYEELAAGRPVIYGGDDKKGNGAIALSATAISRRITPFTLTGAGVALVTATAS